MKMRSAAVLSLGLALVAAGCTSGGTQPSGTTSVVAPKGVVPAPNATIRYIDQPVTLSVANAVVSQPGTTTYTFEVSSDSNFSSKVQTKANVAEGTGATNVKLDQLAGSADYYWHVRAISGGTVGTWSPAYKFTVGPPIVVQAPSPISPVSGAETDSMPTFTVANAQKSGPAGALVYRFEASNSPSFSPLALDIVVPEGSNGRTQLVSPVELPAETTVYWRVTAVDQANGVSSPVSTTASIATNLSIDLTKVVYLNSPNISGWKRTGFLQAVEQDGATGLVCTRFTDPGWPDSLWVYRTEPGVGYVFANQWYFAKIGGTWYGGAGEWIYRQAASVCKSGQNTDNIGPDAGFGEPFSSWRPRVGERVGYAVSAVARRGAVAPTVSERTQVIVLPWVDSSRSSLTPPALSFAAPWQQ